MTYRLIDAEEIKKAMAWLSKYWGKPAGTEYYDARTVDEAVSLLKQYGKDARLIAGGVDLLGLMKNRVLSPGVLVNIKSVPGLRYLASTGIGLDLGTLTLINDIERSAQVKGRYPMLYEAARSIGSPQVRNMGTIGGNLCQDVRCWYYRRPPDTGITFNCRRKISDGVCYAVNGENQYHAIMCADRCFGVCPSDMATALVALDARVNTVSSGGGRSVPVAELYSPLGMMLDPDEVITSVHVPEIAPEVRQRFMKFRVRKAIDFAIVSAAVVIKTEKGAVSDSRIVIGGVAHKPYRSTKAEQLLLGKPLNASLAEEAAGAALAGVSPLSKNEHKVPIAKALLKRAMVE